MSHTAQNAGAYLRTKVLSASPEELRLMLLDGAVKFARQGREGLATGDHEAAYNGITQCRNIIVELMTTMRDDLMPDLCEKLRSLYVFMFSHLVEANLERDLAKADTVIELLEYERETWVMLMDRLAAERRAATTDQPAPPAPAEPAPRRAAYAQQSTAGALSIEG